jgi:hypothetical protein
MAAAVIVATSAEGIGVVHGSMIREECLLVAGGTTDSQTNTAAVRATLLCMVVATTFLSGCELSHLRPCRR